MCFKLLWGYIYLTKTWSMDTAWKVSVFGVFLSVFCCIQFGFGKIRTRKTPNTDTFHALGTGMAAYDSEILYHDLHLVGCPFSYWISTRLKNNPSVKLFLKELSFLRNSINFLTNSSADHADLQFQIPSL